MRKDHNKKNTGKDRDFPRSEKKGDYSPKKKDYKKSEGFDERRQSRERFDDSFSDGKEKKKPRDWGDSGLRRDGKDERRSKFSRDRFDQEKAHRPKKSFYDKKDTERSFPRSEKKFKDDHQEFRGKRERSEEAEEGQLIYKGRDKSEKPVYQRFSKSESENKGFKKPRKRSYDQGPEGVRPKYDFDKLEKSRGVNRDQEIFRLNKYIANAGICSRREADILIQNGEITVNGNLVTELGYKVKRSDTVVFKGKRINPEKLVYILLNKPKDFITTTDDPMERKTVMHLISNACDERVYPVGRLDRNTTGLLLFTNDGELASKLSHPSHEVKKIYQVTLDKPLTKNHEVEILEGLKLEDGPAPVDDLQVLSLDRTILGLEIHLGRNRIVRRIFAELGYEVVALDRVMYAGLDKRDLARGRYRFLTEKEVIRLKYFSK